MAFQRTDIKFDDKDRPYSRLKFWIKSSALVITKNDNEVEIEVKNSRGEITPGHIRIPINKLPELINALTQIYNEDTL